MGKSLCTLKLHHAAWAGAHVNCEERIKYFTLQELLSKEDAKNTKHSRDHLFLLFYGGAHHPLG